MGVLKPFVINSTDIQFILNQVKFRPLYNALGEVIINWDGTGDVYDANGTIISGGLVAGDAASLAAIATYGTSYQSITDLAGLRDVTGHNNNLTPIHANWGAVDQLFTRSAPADFAHYGTIYSGSGGLYDTTASAALKTYYGKYSDGAVTNGTFNVNGTLNTNYAISVGGTSHAADGTAITINNVVDYTPRMISLATTTAGVTYDTWANHQNLPIADNKVLYTSTHTPIVNWNGIGAIYNLDSVQLWDGVSSFAGTNSSGLPVSWNNTDSDVGIYTLSTMPQAAADAAILNAAWASVYDAAGNLIPVWDGKGAIYADALGANAGGTPLWDGFSSFTGLDSSNAPISWANNGPDTALLMTPAETAAAAVVALDLFGSSLQPNPEAAHHTASEIYYTNGVATVTDWGQLETVALGGLGQVDTQARLAASAGQDDHFIGGLNPGVSPSNGFFVLFGQFFDHGLDFIGKSSGAPNAFITSET